MIGPEVTVPDFTEAVVAYRTFGLEKHTQHNYRLISPHQREPWPSKTMTARCTRTVEVPEGIFLPGPIKTHEAPHKDCGCGIYAYFAPCPVEPVRDYWMMDPFGGRLVQVEALMTMEGRIEVHARGMRAQKATICALGLNETLGADERAALVEIAGRLGVPVVPQDDLPKLASEYGRELPESQRPSANEQPKQPAPGAVYSSSGFVVTSGSVSFTGVTPTKPPPPWWLIGGYALGALVLCVLAVVLSAVWLLGSAAVWASLSTYWYGRRVGMAA